MEIVDIPVGIVAFAERTLLLAGERDAFRRLAGLLSQGVEVEVKGRASRKATAVRFVTAVVPGTLDKVGEIFEWKMSFEERRQVSIQLEDLASCAGSRHAYLDPKSNLTGVQIVASVDEYDADVVFS